MAIAPRPAQIVIMGRGHQALRKGRSSLPGQIYLLTFTTANRQPHFSGWEIASEAARLMTDSPAWCDSKLLAWVLMPDHWHGLLELGSIATLAECVRQLKGATARTLRQQHADLGSIWARGYHDHAIREEDDLVAVARYLVMNPVRAGLVGKPSDYSYWDAIWIDRTKARG